MTRAEFFPPTRPTSPFVREMLARAFEAIARAASAEDRLEARVVASAVLHYVSDERTLTDLLNLLRRAIDLEDIVTLGLSCDIPSAIDGREASYASLFQLADYTFRRGKRKALNALLYSALLERRAVVDAPMIRKEWLIAVSDGGPESERDAVELIEQWVAQPDADLGWFKEILRGRPVLRRHFADDSARTAEKGDTPEGDEIPF